MFTLAVYYYITTALLFGLLKAFTLKTVDELQAYETKMYTYACNPLSAWGVIFITLYAAYVHQPWYICLLIFTSNIAFVIFTCFKRGYLQASQKDSNPES